MANAQRSLSALERQYAALELRKAHNDYDTIAGKLGYASKAGAYKAVMTALRHTLQEPADEVRQLHLERLDAAAQALLPKVKQGDPRSVAQYLGVMKRISDLLGLDAPRKTELTGADGAPLIPASTDELAARFEQLVREQAARLKDGS